jgi:hypothetical protein
MFKNKGHFFQPALLLAAALVATGCHNDVTPGQVERQREQAREADRQAEKAQSQAVQERRQGEQRLSQEAAKAHDELQDKRRAADDAAAKEAKVAADARAKADQERQEANRLEGKLAQQESKKDYVARMESELAVADGKIKDLDRRVDEQSDAAQKEELKARVKQLHQKRENIDKKLSAIKSANPDNWAAERAEFVDAWRDFAAQLDQVQQLVRA